MSVTAILDRKLARDRREEVPITILGLPGGYAMWASSPQRCAEDNCDMQLDVPARTARVGETLTGTLRVEPQRDFECRSVYVALEGSMHHEDNIEREVGEVKVTLADRPTSRRASRRSSRFRSRLRATRCRPFMPSTASCAGTSRASATASCAATTPVGGDRRLHRTGLSPCPVAQRSRAIRFP